MSTGLMGAKVQNMVASRSRTFVLWVQTDKGGYVTRDGGMSWRPAESDDLPMFESANFGQWRELSAGRMLRINDENELVLSRDGGKTAKSSMKGWRIPIAQSLFLTPWGALASGPGGCYLARDGEKWEELRLWREEETGAADFLHAYWMGRYYGFLSPEM
jgi:hypothetical protein